MIIKTIFRQAFLVIITVLLSLQSVVCLAGENKIVGDLAVIEVNSGITKAIVKINGEVAQSGRAVFSSSLIDTNDNSDAIISLGKLGKVKLGANSKLLLSFDDSGIRGDLLAGDIAVLNSAGAVNIKVSNGQTLSLNAGDSASADKQNLPSAPSSGQSGSGVSKFLIAGVIGFAAAAIIYGATRNSNDFQLSGNSTVVSPTK